VDNILTAIEKGIRGKSYIRVTSVYSYNIN